MDKIKNGYVFEVEVDSIGWLMKFVVRTDYNEKYDASIVFKPKNGEILAVTAWLNEKQDSHKSLKANQYCKR